jgi:hypothetical protein
LRIYYFNFAAIDIDNTANTDGGHHTGLLMEIGTNYIGGQFTGGPNNAVAMNPKMSPVSTSNIFGNTLFTLGAHFQSFPPPNQPNSATIVPHQSHLSQQIGGSNGGQGNRANAGGGGFSAYSTILFSNTMMGPNGEVQLSATHHQMPPPPLPLQPQTHQRLNAGGSLAAATNSPPIQQQVIYSSLIIFIFANF